MNSIKGASFQIHREKGKLILIVLLTAASCFLTYYFHVVLGTGTLVTHFYYIPIILSCIWWQRRGLVVAVFLAGFLVLSHTLIRSYAVTPNDYLRAFMLIVIAFVLATLSERISKSEAALRKAHDELETRVEERTAELAKANRELRMEIEQRQRVEERLERSAKELEQRNEEIKRFAYIVSHDLRAPLINLKGFASELRHAVEVIATPVNSALPHLKNKQQSAVTTALQDVAEALGFIDSSVNRMDGFINAVLRLSRLGRCELEFERIDMNALVEETLQTLAHQIEKNRIRVTVGSLPQAVADRVSMQQIMGNLLSNAALYLDPKRPGKIEITAKRDSDQMVFHVRDNGRGIAKDDMDKVFAPFRRASKQDVPGEGMGLPYAQTLVNRHGGHIWCESEPGVGTTFSFTISDHLAKKGKEHE